MTKLNQTVTATRATIKLGSIELDAYQMPDGCYKLSVSQAAEAANLYHKRVGQIFEKKGLKALLPEGLVVGNTYIKAKVETSKGLRQASLIDLKYVSLLWANCGTVEGQALVSACLMETLERRCDDAFAVKVTEEERNVRFEGNRLEFIEKRFAELMAETKATYTYTFPEIREFEHFNDYQLCHAMMAKEQLEGQFQYEQMFPSWSPAMRDYQLKTLARYDREILERRQEVLAAN